MVLHDDDTGRGATLEAVLAELKRGKAVPCYLLYGDEEFRLRDAVEKITSSLIPDARDRELNLFVTDGEHEDVGSLCESLITPPLLPGRKVLLVRETRLSPLPEQRRLVGEVRAGGVAETVALSPILGGKSFFHCHLWGIGETPILADSSMEPFRRRLRRFNRQCLEGV